MSEQPGPSGSTRSQWLSSARWCAAAVSASIVGAIASFIVGGFIILVLGMAIVATAGGGSGARLNQIEFVAMLVLAPAIVAACTFGAATAAWRVPRIPARRASPGMLAVSSALTTVGFIATHRPGYIDYVNKPPSIIAYVAATTVAAGTATFFWQRREGSSELHDHHGDDDW